MAYTVTCNDQVVGTCETIEEAKHLATYGGHFGNVRIIDELYVPEVNLLAADLPWRDFE